MLSPGYDSPGPGHCLGLQGCSRRAIRPGGWGGVATGTFPLLVEWSIRAGRVEARPRSALGHEPDREAFLARPRQRRLLEPTEAPRLKERGPRGAERPQGGVVHHDRGRAEDPGERRTVLVAAVDLHPRAVPPGSAHDLVGPIGSVELGSHSLRPRRRSP